MSWKIALDLTSSLAGRTIDLGSRFGHGQADEPRILKNKKLSYPPKELQDLQPVRKTQQLGVNPGFGPHIWRFGGSPHHAIVYVWTVGHQGYSLIGEPMCSPYADQNHWSCGVVHPGSFGVVRQSSSVASPP